MPPFLWSFQLPRDREMQTKRLHNKLLQGATGQYVIDNRKTAAPKDVRHNTPHADHKELLRMVGTLSEDGS